MAMGFSLQNNEMHYRGEMCSLHISSIECAALKRTERSNIHNTENQLMILRRSPVATDHTVFHESIRKVRDVHRDHSIVPHVRSIGIL